MDITILPNNVLAKLGEDICGEIMKYHQLSDATLICELNEKHKAFRRQCLDYYPISYEYYRFDSFYMYVLNKLNR